ncbi:MAG: thiamine phosphate synthase [Beijerinckiaceae bacterium]
MSKQSLYLITPPVADPSGFQPVLQAALKAVGPKTSISCLHLRLATQDEKEVKRILAVLAPVVQDAGIALLIDPPADLRNVARWGCDGVHIADPEALKSALSELKPDRIVGAGGLRSRDAAMTAGESGCDYLMFGEPRADGSLPPLEQVEERCRWWAEVFTTPCVAYAPSLEAVPVLAATGAEFIALGPWAFDEKAQSVAAAAKLLKA